MTDPTLIPDLYRKEYSRLVSLLCSRFGMAFIETAEDIVSDTFLSAAETWGQKGVPENPTAWLYAVARNKALNGIKHDQLFETRIRPELSHSGVKSVDMEIDLSPQSITDSQLQMMFAVCHPSIPPEAQVSLALRILCGFTIDEIAGALLTSSGTINKRLFRARDRLRTGHVKISLPGNEEISARLDTVLVTIYLLFNEGYYSAGTDRVLRKDLCLEAMRLAWLLAGYPQTCKPKVYALLALMCFQASRFDARISRSGDMILYEDQDSSLWDRELINRGNSFFVQAFRPGELSRYHLEAGIAWWHTHPSSPTEKWENILRLYNQLLILEYSPMAALNRAYAFFRVYGRERAIVEAEGLRLSGNLFYHSLLGELFTDVDNGKAVNHFEKALELAGTEGEKAVLAAKLSVILQAGKPAK